MKKCRISSSALVCLLVAMGACSDDVIWDHGKTPDDGLAMKIHAVIDQQMETRADESGFADGDRMGIFVVNYENGVPTLRDDGNQADNVAFTFDSDMNRWNPVSPVYWKDAVTPADVIGYYPFRSNIGDPLSISFQVSANQSKRPEGEMSDYESSDFLWSKATAVTPGTSVNLAYTHLMAGVMVTLQAGEGFTGTEWSKLPKQVAIANILRDATIDLSTGSVTPAGDYDRDIVASPQSGDVFRAVTVPQKVADGKAVLRMTIDGQTYEYKRSGGMEYAGGKLHRFTMRVDKRGESEGYKLTLVSEDIVPWIADEISHDFESNSYLVVNCPAAGKLKESIIAVGSDPETVKNLKVTGILDTSDCFFIRDEMPALSSLNLKDTKFPYVYMGRNPFTDEKYYDKNALPSSAFAGNDHIRRYILPESVYRIGGDAFSNTRPTSTIIIPESVTVLDGGSFGYIWEEASLVLPSRLERLEDNALLHTDIRFEMKLPPTLKYIGNGALAETRNAYGTFSIPSGLEFLGDDAFHECGNNMTGDVVIPPGLVTDLAFSVGFANGTNVTLPEGIKTIRRLGEKFNSRLRLPKSLERIEYQAFAFSCFTTPIDLPENLVYIAPGAFIEAKLPGRIVIPPLIESVENSSFYGNRLTEVIVGDNVLRIEDYAFGRNPELRYMEIGKNIEYIGEGVLSESWKLQTLVCMAKEPPRATEASFRDLYFDKAVLEVPQGCVEKYRHAEGWRQFRNITEHRELAFNINEIACLDRGVVREGILTAEGPWRVASTPSWVHVTPAKGDHKEEIAVKVDSQSHSSAERSGEIKFVLDGTDYTVSIPVRQLRAEDPEDKEIVLQKATGPGKAIPVFIVGEGFTADQIVNGSYMEKMRQTMEHFFDIEPYRTYRSCFTVSTAIACSPEAGSADDLLPVVNKFGTRSVSPNEGRLREYVEKVSSTTGTNMENALIIVVTNLNVFSGWSSISYDGCSFASVGIVDDPYPYDQRGLVQHYAGGEAFAGLGDENVTHFEHIRSCGCPQCNGLERFNEMKRRGFFANLSMSPKMSEVPWRDFIFHERYSVDVDMWDGGYHHLRGVWRSESQSVMGTYIAYFNTISRYTIYRQIKKRAGLPASLDDFVANDKIEKP